MGKQRLLGWVVRLFPTRRAQHGQALLGELTAHAGAATATPVRRRPSAH